ncbi:MAG TPA: hypothetical protein PLR96_01710 [Flavobacteriales bacterium]|jgi:hypothetical protein|nr:hypothetical protein [Flavobacteriales bacterium]
MNLNLLSYLIFLPAMMAIAMWTARSCHRNGRVWMLGIFDGDAPFVDAINNVLLVGCYTLNLGYVAMVMSLWEPITGLEHMLATLVHRIALILLSLAAIHFTNIGVLLVWSLLRARDLAPQQPTLTNTSLP